MREKDTDLKDAINLLKRAREEELEYDLDFGTRSESDEDDKSVSRDVHGVLVWFPTPGKGKATNLLDVIAERATKPAGHQQMNGRI